MVFDMLYCIGELSVLQLNLLTISFYEESDQNYYKITKNTTQSSIISYNGFFTVFRNFIYISPMQYHGNRKYV